MAIGLAYFVLLEEGFFDENVREVHERVDPLSTLTDSEFINHYGLTKEATRAVCDYIREDLQRSRVNTRTTLTVAHQVLIALRFYHTGLALGDLAKDKYIKCSRSTASRTVYEVTMAICHKMSHFIRFPKTHQEKARVKDDFYELSGIPGCLGAIDGTLVALQPPSENPLFPAVNYVCNKGYHALNVIIVCDSKKRITCIESDHPGAYDKNYTWRKSLMKMRALDGELCQDEEWLVGDAAYPLEPWLMTPVLHSSLGLGQEKYNEALKKVTTLVKQCIHLLKGRFHCLQSDERKMNFCPERCSNIAIACAILHNICLDYNIPLGSSMEHEFIADEEETEFSTEVNAEDEDVQALFNHALDIRQKLILRMSRA